MNKKQYYKGSIASLREFWEEKGKTKSFEREYSIRLEGIKQIIKEVRPHLRGQLVLDVGCGPGLATSLFPANTRVIALDFSIWMLRSARNRIAHVVQGSAFNLPFRDSVFSAVTCLFVASDYSDKKGIFCEAKRVLQKKGLLFFSDYSLNDKHWKFKRTIRPLMGEKCNIFLEDEAFLSNMMTKAGFRVQETKRPRFTATFKLERYVGSEDEMTRLKAKNQDLWNDVQLCIKNKKIDREFILISAVK